MKIHKTKTLLALLAILLAGSALAVAADLPASLAGTEPDGALRLDERGELLVDSQLRLFFDYYLSARGEVTDEALAGLVAQAAAQRLPAAAATETASLFGDYLHYLELAEARLSSVQDPARAAEAHARLRSLRAEVFGAEASRALFGDQLRLEKAALALQLTRLEATTPVQLEAARRAYEKTLPADERAARSAALGPLEVRREVAALRAAGATEDEVWSVRARAFGAEAADRLAALDEARAEWTIRLERYRAERRALMLDQGLGEKARLDAAEALFAASFTPLEQRRVRALEGR